MAKFNFRRGEAVIHYSLVGPHRGYWGSQGRSVPSARDQPLQPGFRCLHL